ncbi:MAG: 3-deoxy-D-manno-octulosonic acid transferase [Planctomyces sp.]|nr:3-deoxy-D-manno-octulosonic acid transferase [Planctomyces sp.]
MSPRGSSAVRCAPPVAGWLLNAAYLLLLTAAAPLLVYRRLRYGKYRAGWREKFLGAVPIRRSAEPCLWLHAVSVGEVLLLRPIISAIRAARPDIGIWISTTTPTGRAVAQEKFPNAVVFYCPLDFTWAVRRAIRRVRPDVVALAELELWPNLIAAVHASGCPLLLLNGRMGERSFRGYRRARIWIGRILARFEAITAQTIEYADRFAALGAPRDRIVVTGSVKYDGLEVDRQQPRTLELRSAFGLSAGDAVFIAGSTQAIEEAAALDAWESLRPEFPNLRLVIVPRHAERFDDAARMIERRGHLVHRRSSGHNAGESSSTGRGRSAVSEPSKSSVLLLDTLGELGACWGLADIAFVGGSLTSRGGQNMLEPAAYGAAVIVGPNTWNFRHDVELLRGREALTIIPDGAALAAAIRELLRNPEARRGQGQRARNLVLAQQGATARVVGLVLESLSGAAAGATRRAA